LKVEIESQFNTAGSREFQVKRCGSAERSSGKWCPSKWHAQLWDGRRSSVACGGAQRDVPAQILLAENTVIGIRPWCSIK